ncbi:MAG: hypothetical protein WAS23_15505 [Dokdonella sp.]|uniref:hypothetical protein n=1 Tax=Dokdonella sp. TaxID=2291710 RepID=UPI003BB20F96
MKIFFVAQLNARLQPVHRGEYFEDPLNVELKKAECGEVSGGGSLQSKIGEIEYCDIEIEVNGALTVAERVVIETLEGLGAPKGSKLHIEAEGRQVQFGQAEGIAVYLNGTGLPDEVYKECDSNFVYSEFDRLLNGEGRVLSYWQGPSETAFYMYGHSFQEMNSRLTEFLASYPLCDQCRVEQIA